MRKEHGIKQVVCSRKGKRLNDISEPTTNRFVDPRGAPAQRFYYRIIAVPEP